MAKNEGVMRRIGFKKHLPETIREWLLMFNLRIKKMLAQRAIILGATRGQYVRN
jgi:hypothetical protein